MQINKLYLTVNINSMPIRLFLILFVLQCAPAWAQTDVFTGIWQMQTAAGNTSVVIELKIGAAEKSMLYPAAITIKSSAFYGVYQLLLVKKKCVAVGHK